MSSQVLNPNTEAAILARVIESDSTAITPDVAHYLLSMQLPARDEERSTNSRPKPGPVR